MSADNRKKEFGGAVDVLTLMHVVLLIYPRSTAKVFDSRRRDDVCPASGEKHGES